MKARMSTVFYGIAIACMIVAKDTQSRHFVIVIPTRNNSEWVERNLSSVLSQDYDDWQAICINDASTDDTGHKIAQFITAHALQDRILLINNETRQGALANMVKAVYLCADWDIVVTLDGDDWLNGADVLQKLNNVYRDENIWMTYGSYQEYPSGKKGLFSKQIPQNIIASNGYRRHPWSSSHLRTFYAWLFKCIKLDDFKFEGQFFSVSGDLAHIIPLLELSGGRFKYISDLLYVYNVQTPLNDHKINRALQAKMEKNIRARAPYQPLSGVPAKYLQRH